MKVTHIKPKSSWSEEIERALRILAIISVITFAVTLLILFYKVLTM